MTAAAASSRRSGVTPDVALAGRLFRELAERTGSGKGVTRASWGLGEQIAHDMVRREARALGMTAETDAACNLYLTLPGAAPGPRLMIGSHLDSVPLGGNYDGAAGVLMGLAVAAGFARAGIAPPVDLTVMAIRGEESTWFGSSYIGSRAAFGRVTGAELDGILRAGDRVALGTAIDAAGGDSAALRAGRPHLDPAGILMFIEPHIEQGPVLEARGLPLGIVTGIRGSFRFRTGLVLGAYAHSGATPREGRQDAVRALAMLIVANDDLWQRLADAGRDLTVTFGQVQTDPNEAAFSKVAGRVSFAMDVRSADPETLTLVEAEFARLVAGIGAAQGVTFQPGPRTASAPAAMHPGVVAALEAAAARAQVPAITMPSGAGHDAATFAGMGVPAGMLFLRNSHGSHNPDEHMEMADFAAGAEVLTQLALSPPKLR